MRHFFAVIVAVLGLGILASAQVPTAGNIFLGYSYFNADTNVSNRTNLNGWNGSLEGKVFPFVGIVADVGEYYGTQSFPVGICTGVIGSPCTASSDFKTRILTATFGPRVSFSVGKFRPFVHGLIGVGRTSGSLNGSDMSLADTLGGGIDYHLVPLIAWRVQADEVQTRFFHATQNNFRLSTGIVFHF